MPKTLPPPKADRSVSIRIRESQRAVIDQAASILGKTRSDFMLETACREAESVILDQRLFHLDEEAFQRFVERLDAPPKSKPELRRLLRGKSPWD